MARIAFDREMKRLQDKVLDLGEMVANAIVESIDILTSRDHDAARLFIEGDAVLNRLRFELENDILTLIATQQPMAGDLRTLAAMLEYATELERMGDYAKGIAKISIMIGDEPFIKPLVDIPRMARRVKDMLHRALEAFIRLDAEAARAIPREDNEIDQLYNQIYRELMTYIIANPKNIEQANYLIWVAHNLERAADRVVNICERVVFTVTGEMIEMDM
jgi:phosphate transport system protein